MPDTPPVVICHVISIPDADGANCQGGVRIRLAGISARERDGSCNSPVCPTMRVAQATPIARQLMVGKTIRFRIYGRSGKRLVGDHVPTRCQLLRSGAVVQWPRYMREYRLQRCGRGW